MVAIRRIFILLILLCLIGVTVSANERSAVWSRLYRRSQTLEDKHTLMQTVAQNPSADLIPMLVGALDELNAMRGQSLSNVDIYYHTELTKIVVRTIGEVGAVEAGDLVYDVSKNATDPFVKGEAIFTLGRLGMEEHAEDIAMSLKNLNLNLADGTADANSEALAYACILALERLKAPAGFAPLFFASIGWYSPTSGVRPRATEVMQELIDDPTEVLYDIIRLESDSTVKLEALLAEIRSNAPPEGKAKIAIEALRQGLNRQAGNVSEENNFRRLRLEAMNILIESQVKSDQAIDYLAQVMRGTYDINEQITAIVAVATQRSAYAVNTLVEFLKKQNERQMAGVTPADYRTVISTIQVLGQIGSEDAVEELMAVGLSNWPNSIVREAKAALKLLGY